MFFEWDGPRSFDGRTDYIDLSDDLHYFLHAKALSADVRFCTEASGYQTLLAVYFKESLLPDFSIGLHKGRAALTVRRGGGLRVYAGGEACCDGLPHLLSFRGEETGVRVWLDGRLVIEDAAPGPWCEFGYVGFATAGRGTRADQYEFFRGEMYAIRVSDQPEALPDWKAGTELKRTDLFAKGMSGVENFRIPMLITVGETVIASADARMEAPGDNPNHICRAVRISRDSGESWSDLRIFDDFGGKGRRDGASAIDGSFLYDGEKDVLFMIYSHTSGGIGMARCQPGVGMDRAGRKVLRDASGTEYYCEADGRVCTADGRDTGYQVDAYGRLTRNGAEAGSICHGADRKFCQADTSFLKIIESRDGGESWSEPRDLNGQVKQEWMRFLGAGPGTGIQIQEGAHKGRLVYPVYVSNEHKVCSSGAIFSDDHGETWHLGGLVNDGRTVEGKTTTAKGVSDRCADMGECQITELPGGRLKIFLRNLMPEKRTAAAYSDDGGESWYGVELQEELPDPACQSHVLRISHEGRDLWLFSNPADEESRVRGTVRLSTDGTRTWNASRLAEPGEFCYSCMAKLPDGQIGMLYEGRDIAQRFVKFPVEWVLRGSERA